MVISIPQLQKECKLTLSRSGGKGGQHVNKVETKVQLSFDIVATTLLNEEQKNRIYQKLEHKINDNGCLQVDCQEGRTQLDNKEKAFLKLQRLIEKALHIAKPRKKTVMPQAVKQTIKATKQKQSAIKLQRKKWTGEDNNA